MKIETIKKALVHAGFLDPDFENSAWGPAHENGWRSFCDKYGGRFSHYPDIMQEPEFDAQIERLAADDYIHPTRPVREGVNVKDYMPEPMKIVKEIPKDIKSADARREKAIATTLVNYPHYVPPEFSTPNRRQKIMQQAAVNPAVKRRAVPVERTENAVTPVPAPSTIQNKNQATNDLRKYVENVESGKPIRVR